LFSANLTQIEHVSLQIYTKFGRI